MGRMRRDWLNRWGAAWKKEPCGGPGREGQAGRARTEGNAKESKNVGQPKINSWGPARKQRGKEGVKRRGLKRFLQGNGMGGGEKLYTG